MARLRGFLVGRANAFAKTNESKMGRSKRQCAPRRIDRRGRVKNGLPKEEDLIVSLAIQSSGKWLQETILRQSGVSELAP